MTRSFQSALTTLAIVPLAVVALVTLAVFLVVLWPFIVLAVYTYEKRKVLATPTPGVYLNSRKV